MVDESTECQESMFVNLQDNKEVFTGYEGTPVWTAIYAENCACSDEIPKLKGEAEETCSENTLLYQMMSGLHTSISTHIAANFEVEGMPTKNLTYFDKRVAQQDDRVKNFFLIYAATVKAFKLLEPAYKKQTDATLQTQLLFKTIAEKDRTCGDYFNEALLF